MERIVRGTLLLVLPAILFAGGNPGNPLRKFTVEDSVRWTLENLEFAYNEGLLEDVLLHFTSDYSDVNGVNITALGTILTQVLGNEGFRVGNNNFLMYNASAQVKGNLAFLTATIHLGFLSSADANNLFIVTDTLTLRKVGGNWFITSAPNLVAGFGRIIGLPMSSQEPHYQHPHDEYDSENFHNYRTDTQGDNDVQR